MENEKKVYSLMELVEEIWEIPRDEDIEFDNHYKALQRIDSILRKSSYHSNTKGILAESKDKYVKYVKNIIKDEKIKKIFTKLSKKKELKDEEIKIYYEFISNIEDSYVKINIENIIRTSEKIKTINKKFFDNLKLYDEHFGSEINTDLLNIVLDKYEEGLDKLHEDIKKIVIELDLQVYLREKILNTAIVSKYGIKNVKYI